jgi:hypothetical protein
MQADVSAHNCSDGGFAVELRLRASARAFVASRKD